MKFGKFFLVIVLTIFLLIPSQAAQGSQSVNSSLRTWEDASSELGFRGNLLRPSYSAGFSMNDKIQVLAFGRTGNSSRDFNYRKTSVNAIFGGFKRGFSVDQKWSGTAWAAAPQFDSASRPVGTFRVTRIENGRAMKVSAKLFANCDSASRETGTVHRTKCGKLDIKRFGGYLTMKVESENAFGELRGTDLVIQSKGLTFGQLVKIAEGMEKVD